MNCADAIISHFGIGECFFGFRAQTRGRKLWKRRPGCRHGSRSVSRKAKEFGFCARTRGRKLWKRRPGCRHGSRSAVRKAKEFGFRARTRGRKLWKRRPGCRHSSRSVSRKANEFGFHARTRGRRRPGCRHGSRSAVRKANEFGFHARTRGRRLPGRAHSGHCSGICTRKNLHFYTQSCIIIPTPLKAPRRSGFTAISIREIAVNPYYHRAEAPMRVCPVGICF